MLSAAFRCSLQPPSNPKYTMAPTITDLFVYPIKSCHGISLQSACITTTGFLFDRQWMIVNPTNGRFLTQRQNERLALIRPILSPEAISAVQGETPLSNVPPNDSLSLSAPGMPQLKVPLFPEKYKKDGVVPVGVWAWKGEACDAGEEASLWLLKFLGSPYRLVRFIPGTTKRETDQYAPGFDLAFSDEVPYMVISKASVRQLCDSLPSPVPFTRFRPNIILDGGEPFEEDRWRVFTVAGEARREFRCVKPRARCKITTIDQETAEVGSEPLSTLRTLRSGAKLDLPGPLRSGGYFGMNTVCHVDPKLQRDAVKDPSLLSVRIGQEIQVQRWADRAGADIGTLWGA